MVALMRGIVVSVLMCAVVGCSRNDPLANRVESQTVIAFSMWKTKAAQRVERDVWKAFEDACAELKLSLMIRQVASGSDAVDEAFRSAIHGRPMREVINEGLSKRRERLEASRDELEQMMAANQKLRTKPEDEDSSNYLKGIRSNQEQRMAKLREEIEIVVGQLELIRPPASR